MLHDGAEGQRRHDEPDGVQHLRHASAREQGVDGGLSGPRYEAGRKRQPDAFENADRRGQVEISDEGYRHMGIEDRRDDAAQQRAGEDRDERRKAQDRKGEDRDERKEGPERNIEMLRQIFHRMAGFAGNRMTEPREEQGGQHEGGNGSPERFPDQLEQIGAGDRGREVERVRQGRRPVAEKGAGDDRAGAISGDMPRLAATPIRPTPIVPMTVQELPTAMATRRR